jgi:hypothetical protein
LGSTGVGGRSSERGRDHGDGVDELMPVEPKVIFIPLGL